MWLLLLGSRGIIEMVIQQSPDTGWGAGTNKIDLLPPPKTSLHTFLVSKMGLMGSV